MQNFMNLSPAVHESSCWQREKHDSENNTAMHASLPRAVKKHKIENREKIDTQPVVCASWWGEVTGPVGGRRLCAKAERCIRYRHQPSSKQTVFPRGAQEGKQRPPGGGGGRVGLGASGFHSNPAAAAAAAVFGGSEPSNIDKKQPPADCLQARSCRVWWPARQATSKRERVVIYSLNKLTASNSY